MCNMEAFTNVRENGKRQVQALTLLNVLQFTTRILWPKYPRSLFPLLSKLCVLHQFYKRGMINHVVRPVPLELMKILIAKSDNYSLTEYAIICVLVPFSTLNFLCISSGSWARMKIMNNEIDQDLADVEGDDTIPVKHSCFVEMIGMTDLEDSTVLLTDVMFHNLSRAGMIQEGEETRVMFSNILHKQNLSEYSAGNFTPLTALNAKVSLMQTPHEINNEAISEMLQKYFSLPRYLAQGDVFGIDVRAYSPLLNHTVGNQNLKILFFVVTEINGPVYTDITENDRFGYFVLKGETFLHQKSNENSFLPPKTLSIIDDFKNITSSNYNSYILSICPGGLFDYYQYLVESFQPFLSVHHKIEIKPMFLLFGPQGVGKRVIVKCTAKSLGLNVMTVNCLHFQSGIPGYAEGKLKMIFTKARKYSPCILLMKNIETLCTDKDGEEDSRAIAAFHEEIRKLYTTTETSAANIVILVGTCDTNNDMPSTVPPSLARSFLNVMHIASPSDSDRLEILNWLLKRNMLVLEKEVSLVNIAARSSGFLYEDLVALVSQASRNCYKRLRRSWVSSSFKEIPAEICLEKDDFESALETMHAAYADSIGAPKIPAVSWSDVGGLSNLKEEILRTITMPIRHPELFNCGLRRSGLLLYGPPGTGKTLLAKAVATECNLNFLSVKGPELLNMYVGQSEENVREVFQRARSSSPCIIFFDELDSLAPNRGRSGDSGGVMDRVVSQLLAEMDGLQKATQLFVIGATNRPDLIDPALLRPGRFDKLLYVGICADRDAQLSVMTALTRKFHLKPDVSLESIVSRLPAELTGADMYSLCTNAWMNAVKTCITNHQQEQGDTPISSCIEVGSEDFEAALTNTSPSVSPDDLRYYQDVHQQISNHYIKSESQ